MRTPSNQRALHSRRSPRGSATDLAYRRTSRPPPCIPPPFVRDGSTFVKHLYQIFTKLLHSSNIRTDIQHQTGHMMVEGSTPTDRLCNRLQQRPHPPGRPAQSSSSQGKPDSILWGVSGIYMNDRYNPRVPPARAPRGPRQGPPPALRLARQSPGGRGQTDRTTRGPPPGVSMGPERLPPPPPLYAPLYARPLSPCRDLCRPPTVGPSTSATRARVRAPVA